MKTYKITGYTDAAYVVTLDENGIIDVDGLLPTSAEAIKASVERNMKNHGLSVLPALGRAIGSYATAEEIDTDTSVSDLL